MAPSGTMEKESCDLKRDRDGEGQQRALEDNCVVLGLAGSGQNNGKTPTCSSF